MRISDGSSDECSSDHEIGASLSFRPLMLLLGVQFLNSFAFGSLTSLFVFFAAAVLDLDAQSAVLLFASFIGGAPAAPHRSEEGRVGDRGCRKGKYRWVPEQ